MNHYGQHINHVLMLRRSHGLSNQNCTVTKHTNSRKLWVELFFVSDQLRKIIVRYKLIGYNVNVMRQSACLVFNPITVNNYASLFNCTLVGRQTL